MARAPLAGSTPRLVIFDVDGTLVDSQAHIVDAMAKGFAAIGQPCPPRAAVLSIVGLSLPQAVARLAPDLDDGARDQVVQAYKQGYSGMRAATMPPLYPGAAAALRALADRPGVVLGIATGKSRRGLGFLLDHYGLTGLFATTQVADDHPSKPHPAMVQAALAETGIAAGRAVMLGDTSFDMLMARAAGVAALGVAWGYHPVADLLAAGAGQVLQDFADLLPALDRLWAQQEIAS